MTIKELFFIGNDNDNEKKKLSYSASLWGRIGQIGRLKNLGIEMSSRLSNLQLYIYVMGPFVAFDKGHRPTVKFVLSPRNPEAIT